jgi:hypothetical protein
VNYDALTAWGTIAGAVATFLAVLVALFLEPWRRSRAAPRLWLTWRKRDSTSKIDTHGRRETFVRLFVQNMGHEAAQRVEVMISDACRLSEDGSVLLISSFLPTALTWTHTRSHTCDYLPGGADRLCDLGVFYASAHPNTSLAHHGPTYFRCATQIEPTNKYNYFKTGKYIVRLVASALNAKHSTLTVVLTVGEHVVEGDQISAAFSLIPASVNLKARYLQFLSGQERSG